MVTTVTIIGNKHPYSIVFCWVYITQHSIIFFFGYRSKNNIQSFEATLFFMFNFS